MKQAFLLVLVSLCCFVSSESRDYIKVYIYIAPTQLDCDNITDSILCNTLQQLIVNGHLSSSKFQNEGSVELSFLPGTHLMPEKETLNVTDLSEVVIHPWKEFEELEVIIECKDYEDISFWFHNIIDLKIVSLCFSSCKLQYSYEINSEAKRSVSITKSVFEKGTIAIYSTKSNLNVGISNCTFSSTKKMALSILTPDYNQENFIGRITIAHLQITNTQFQDNIIDGIDGYGYVTVVYTNLTIRKCHFINNSSSVHVGRGGVIYAASSSLTLHSTAFLHCGSYDGTALLLLQRSSGTIDMVNFVNNSATDKGIVRIEDSQLSISNSVFKENNGTALLINSGPSLSVNISNCTFTNNSGHESGGALYVHDYGNVYIHNSSFSFNTAGEHGGAIYCEDSTISITSLVHSFSNAAERGNGGFAYLSNCDIRIMSEFVINSSRASNGGAIYAQLGSDIVIKGKATFANNSACKNGGAFFLDESNLTVAIHGSALHGPALAFPILDHDSLIFSNNVAKQQGGAMYVSDTNCESSESCFLQGNSVGMQQPLSMLFMNNTASQGPVLYGGLLDRCHATDHVLGIDYLKAISKYEHTPNAITSDPVRICLCTENHELDCTTRNLTVSNKVRGQAINLLGAVVDQDNNPRTTYIRAKYNTTTAELGKGEGRRETDNNCSKLSYHIYTRDTSATLILQLEGVCESSDFSRVTVYIEVKPCPKGFQDFDDRCECDQRLSKHFNNIVCDKDTDTILRKESIWLRYDEHYLKVHSNCLLDYCLETSDNISLESPDEQCANNRSGVICGGCQDNYSIGLGGSKCLQCTSNYPIIWLIPVFAVAGVALVALLLVCNMTISHGTLNGLIFYANIVSITRLTSLQSCSVHPILSVFIAWLNLDFGVETCFYSGMDTYQKTWLQFVFPLYIWLLVGAIIVVSHYSFTAVKVFGRNNIAVLATLFLLSYSKILKTIIRVLSITQVFQGSANDTSDQLVPYNVWMYDGNIEYLKGKHVPLFAVALVFLVFLFLPYTLLLMFGQCIRSIPTQRKFVLRFLKSAAFVSIMDAYHAPYNNRHHYWTGLMLLSRCVLFLAFASYHSDNALLANMTSITTLILIGILAIKSCATKVYKHFFMNVLEVFFLLNLVILSGTVHYLRDNDSDDVFICTSATVSVSVSMIVFTGILAYHARLQMNKTRCFKSINNAILAKWRKHYHAVPAEENVPPANPALNLPTTMVVELREELLTDQ